MSIGQEGDSRKFQKATKAQKEDSVTSKVLVDLTPLRICHVCKQTILGKFWDVGGGKFECHRCHNE